MFTAKGILVNELEYAAVLLQNSHLDINATVYRYSLVSPHDLYQCLNMQGFICQS